MSMLKSSISLGLIVVLSAIGAADEPAASTVQLPTFAFTTVGTTISAPDGGSAYLGGIKRLSEGSVTRGVPILGKVPMLNRFFKNRGIGRSVSAQNFHVSPRIIILEEEEAALLGEQLARPFSGPAIDGGVPIGAPGMKQGFRGVRDVELNVPQRDAAVERQAGFISQNLARGPIDQPQYDTVDDSSEIDVVERIRRENELAKQERDRKAVESFELGKAAEANGNLGAARVYYNMAARRAKGQFKDDIIKRLNAISGENE